jgi:tetratricopeptide (TPR) repeat protein
MSDLPQQLQAALADRYTLERELGRGGMAVVYLARDLKHDRPVALKVLRPELAASIGADRFLREIRIAARLNHPNILALIDSGEADGHLYYVMPYVKGESLRERLSRETQLSFEDVVRTARQIAAALDHAHAAGVVHRDIKPENILVSSDHVVITDFGIARAVTEAGGERLTETGIAVGTPAYMSPEQASGVGRVDSRSDVYALACVVYEMLAGDPPFLGSTPLAIMGRHAVDTVPSLRAVRRTVPPAMEHAIERALAKVPVDRFGSATQFVEALEAKSVRPKVRPRRRAATTLGAVLLAVVATVTVVTISRGGTALDSARAVVLPFENRTGDPALDQIGLTVAHLTTTDLQLAGVNAVPTPLVRELLRQAELDSVNPIRSVADLTGSATVVSGAYYRQGDSIRMQADVIDARTGEYLDALEPVSGPMPSHIEVVLALSQRVAGVLVAHSDEELPDFGAPPSPEVHREFATGLAAYLRQDRRTAREHFEQAIALDSTYLAPKLYLLDYLRGPAADSLVAELERSRDRLAPFTRAELDWRLAMRRHDYEAEYRAAQELARIAPAGAYAAAWSALKSNRPQAALDHLEAGVEAGAVQEEFAPRWGVLTAALHRLGRHREELGAARDARAALPESLLGTQLEGIALAALGQTDAALQRVDEILVDPQADVAEQNAGGIAYFIALELRAHGHGQAAAEAFRRIVEWFEARPLDLERQPEKLASYGTVLYHSGRLEEARPAFEQYLREVPNAHHDRAYLASIAARQGDRDTAERIVGELTPYLEEYRSGLLHYSLAATMAQLGQLDQAVAFLGAAPALPGTPRYWLGFQVALHRDPDFESLRDHPAFRKFMRPKG